jgi:hypothetical protein
MTNPTTERTMTTDIVVRADPLLPMSVGDAKAAMAAYQDLTGQLLTQDDWQGIPGRGQSFVKKSGWSKIATFYGISTVVVHEKIDREVGEVVRARYTVRASHPNGRQEEATGACSIEESRFSGRGGRAKVEHDLPATAHTRARNRAIANLVGFGAVSAEEMEGSVPSSGPAPAGRPAWAKEVSDDELATAADQIVDLLVALGAKEGDLRVSEIGQAIFDAAGGMPVIVAQVIADLHEAIPAKKSTEPEVIPGQTTIEEQLS